MRYGNCLLGALVLLWTQRKSDPKFLLKVRPSTKIPHFMVRTQEGLHHYRLVNDILPWPFCYIIFEGKFQTVPFEDADNFTKGGMS